jgi:hypothetical protein
MRMNQEPTIAQYAPFNLVLELRAVTDVTAREQCKHVTAA